MRTQNIKKLKSKYRIGLSGTPVDGKLEELHSIYDFLRPGLFPSKTLFMQKHAETDFFGAIKGYRDVKAVNDKIEPYMIRRLKRNVLKDLPDKIYYDRVIEFSDAEMKIYKKLAKREHEITEEVEPMVAAIRCKQFCDSPELIEMDKIKSSKLTAFIEILTEVIVVNGNKAVIFTQYKEMAKLLIREIEKLGLNYLAITGDTDTKLRADMQKEFNNDNSIDIMIGTDAMSTGLNFTSANYVINYDDNWSPSIMAQREDRCVVGGQKVMTRDGMKFIEDIDIGEHVLTHKGRYRKVLKTSSRLHRSSTHTGMTTKIKYRRFNDELETTSDHKLFVLKNGEQEPMWIQADEVRPRDFLLHPSIERKVETIDELIFPSHLKYKEKQICPNGGKEFTNGRYIPISERIPLNEEVCFLIGWYLAEGCASKCGKEKYRSTSFSGHITEEPLLEKISETLKEYFNLNSLITVKPEENSAELKCSSIELAPWMKEMFGKDCYSKQIPDEWLEKLSNDQLEWIVKAYLKGDGYKRGNQQEWVSVSSKLSIQISQIIDTLGYRNTTMRRIAAIPEENRSEQWVGCITQNGKSDSPLIDFKLDGYTCLPVVEVSTKIENRKNLRVYDLTVEEDHSFTVGRAIVHNCHRIGQKDTVTVINFIVKDTIEERIKSALMSKMKLSNAALGDDDFIILKKMSPKEVLELL
jgi:intein/homing endonuclease